MLTRAKGFSAIAVLLMSGAMLSGCQASIGTPSDSSQLERIIKQQLAGKVADKVRNPKVEKVTCVEGAAKKIDCVATLSYDSPKGRAKQDIAISGSCDSKNCIWQTKN